MINFVIPDSRHSSKTYYAHYDPNDPCADLEYFTEVPVEPEVGYQGEYHIFYETWMDCVMGDTTYGVSQGFKRRPFDTWKLGDPPSRGSGIAMVFTHKHYYFGKVPSKPIFGLVPGSFYMFHEYEPQHTVIGYEVTS